MALIKPNGTVVKWLRAGKARSEGTNYGPSWIHWEPPVLRTNDRRLITPVDEDNKALEVKKMHDLIRGKF